VNHRREDRKPGQPWVLVDYLYVLACGLATVGVGMSLAGWAGLPLA
jgi:hypothetical protein